MTSDKKPARIIATDETLLGICEELIFDGVVDLNHVDVSNVTKFSNAFSNLQRRSYVRRLAALQYSTSCYEVTQPPARDEVSSRYRLNVDISEWDVSGGIVFNCMFEGVNFGGDISRWSMGRAKNVSRMFSQSTFNGDIAGWDMRSVIDASGMFEWGAFTGDLSSWKLEMVQNADLMFRGTDASWQKALRSDVWWGWTEDEVAMAFGWTRTQASEMKREHLRDMVRGELMDVHGNRKKQKAL
jgi:Mycoplasma protein of unknown function, DUF285